MPILFHIAPGASIHSGHFMIFLGGLVAILLTVIEMKRVEERPGKIYPLLLILFFSAISGARILFWISSYDTDHFNFIGLLKFWHGGMSLYGGAILAFIVYLIYVIWQRLDFWRTADMLAPSVAIFIFSARVGCLLAGCCYGRQCEPGFPLAVTFRDPAALAPKDGPLYPSQLFFAASALLIFLILWTQRRHKAFEGEISLIGVSIFSVTSFVIEYFRGDARVLYEMFGATISQNQIISAVLFVLSLMLYAYRRGE
jgi:phosphatidylglycerol:prolipoprotein diacylglycerol transferase